MAKKKLTKKNRKQIYFGFIFILFTFTLINYVSILNSTKVLVLDYDKNCDNCFEKHKKVLDNLSKNIGEKFIIHNFRVESDMSDILEIENKSFPIILFSKDIELTKNFDKISSFLEFETYKGNEFYKLKKDLSTSLFESHLVNKLDKENFKIKYENDNSKITLFEISDFSCNFCALSHGEEFTLFKFRNQNKDYVPTMKDIINDYVKTGKIDYVFINKNNEISKISHLFGICAYDQNKFFEMQMLIYKSQITWINQNIQNQNKIFLEFAKELNLDMDKFNNCLADTKNQNILEYEKNLVDDLNLYGTPTFIVNNKIVSGAVDNIDLRKIINEELEK